MVPSIVIALVFALIGLISEFLMYRKHPIFVGVATFLFSFPVYVLVNVFFMSPILSWLDLSGYFVWGALSITIAGGLAAIWENMNSDRDGSYGGAAIVGAIATILLWIIFVFSDWSINPQEPWPFCDNSQYKELASLVSVNLTGTVTSDTNANALVQITPNIAISKVRQQFPQSLATYLQVGSVQIQDVAGHPWAIVSLNPSNMTAFNKNGGYVPGYYRIDALDINAKPEQMFNSQMKYVPGIAGSAGITSWFAENDLNRYVYFNILQPNGWIALDLNTLEVDDNWKPMYTAALAKPSIGTIGYTIDSYLILDPQTGEYKIYPIKKSVDAVTGEISYDISQIPGWVNNIFPQSMYADYLTWWGKYKNHSVCAYEGTSGQYQIDSQNDIFTNTGRQYQFTMTSFNNDASVTHVIYADPKTGKVTGYVADGGNATPIFESISKTMVEKSKRGTTTPSNVEEMQIQQMLGVRVIFAVLTLADNGNGYDVYKPNGFELVQVSQADKASAYIVGDTVDDVYRLLQRQIAQGTGSDQTISETTSTIQIKGTIDRIGSFNDSDGSLRVSIVLRSNESPTGYVRFVGNADNNTSLLGVGDSVTVTALSVDYSSINEAVDIRSDYLSTVTPPTQVPKQ